MRLSMCLCVLTTESIPSIRHFKTKESFAGFAKFKSFELDVGDVIFFNSYIPHKSGPNKSKKSRIQIYLTYNSISAGNFRKRYISEKRKSFPPNNERIKGINYTFK